MADINLLVESMNEVLHKNNARATEIGKKVTSLVKSLQDELKIDENITMAIAVRAGTDLYGMGCAYNLCEYGKVFVNSDFDRLKAFIMSVDKSQFGDLEDN